MDHSQEQDRAERYPEPILPGLEPSERDNAIRLLMISLGFRVPVHLRLYHELEDCAVIGVVDKIDPYNRKFLVDGEWFLISDIVHAVRYD